MLTMARSTSTTIPAAYATTSRLPRSQFTGKERDSESGNDYFGARYYSSAMGRFMSPDWSDTPEAVPYARLDNPQSLNLYAYAGNNPLRITDPDGHDWWSDLKQRWNNLTNGLGWRTDDQVKSAVADAKKNLLGKGIVDGNGNVTQYTSQTLSGMSDKQVLDAQDRWDSSNKDLSSANPQQQSALQQIAASLGGGAQDKKLTSTEIENLEKNTGETAHEIKEGALGTNKNLSKYDLYKNGQGEIVAKPKGSSGPGEPTGYTTEHLETPKQ